MQTLEVKIWGETVGVLLWEAETQTTSFEFTPKFLANNLELAPIINPKSKDIIEVRNQGNSDDPTNFKSDKGLPLFIADSLPDKFGTALFSTYLEEKGKSYSDLTPLEKLSYIGNRGMGALEFYPIADQTNNKNELDLLKLSEISNALLNEKPIADVDNMASLFHIGTSPGGAQPKVLVNINSKTGKVYRGDSMPKEDERCWILKFNKDTGDKFDSEKGKVEYVYSLIANECKIKMTACDLKTVGDASFFMTERFDRMNGEKIHTQTLHAMAGMNYRLPNTYSYEQVMTEINRLNLGYPAKEQLFRIMVFNITGRNADDHTKNISFFMNPSGEWQLAPAYDLTFSYKETYNRPTPHFLSTSGVRINHKLKHILNFADKYSIKNPKEIIHQINAAFLKWPQLAHYNKVHPELIQFIQERLLTTEYDIRNMKLK